MLDPNQNRFLMITLGVVEDELRRSQTDAERALWAHLRNK